VRRKNAKERKKERQTIQNGRGRDGKLSMFKSTFNERNFE